MKWLQHIMGTHAKLSTDSVTPLKIETLRWYGFDDIILASSSQEDIRRQLGLGDKSDWVAWDKKMLGVKLTYNKLGVTFFLKDNRLDVIEIGQRWRGKTCDGVTLGSSTGDLVTLGLAKHKVLGICSTKTVRLFDGIGFYRIIHTPMGADICVSMSFTFASPIQGKLTPPWDSVRVTGIQLSHSPREFSDTALFDARMSDAPVPAEP